MIDRLQQKHFKNFNLKSKKLKFIQFWQMVKFDCIHANFIHTIGLFDLYACPRFEHLAGKLRVVVNPTYHWACPLWSI